MKQKQTPKQKKVVKAWCVLDSKKHLRLWDEGRLATYNAVNSRGVRFMRSKNRPDNFIVTRCEISYTLPTSLKGK